MTSNRSSTTSEPVIKQLARYVAGAQADLGDKARRDIRIALIDTLGCILAGADQDVARKTRETIAGWGTGSSPVYGTGLTLSPPFAAMANATAGHVLDFDDWEVPGNTHPSVVLIPALLAVAGQDGASASGVDILHAYAMGFEVIARVGEATNLEHYGGGCHATATIGTLGAAAAVARLMELDMDGVANALAIAVSQAIGYTCQFGSNTKPLQAGFAAKAGVMAAALARAGLTGQPQAIDGLGGFNDMLSHGDRTRFEKPMARIGNPPAIAEYGLVIKPYPSCGYTHRLIDCALELRAQTAFDPANIVRITASLTKPHAAILPFHVPATQGEALFSAPFCIAQALLRGQLTPPDLADEPWTDPDIVQLMKMTTFEVREPRNPEENYDRDDPDRVVIESRDGVPLQAECGLPLGAPQNAMSDAQITAKFEMNARRPGSAAELMDWDSATDMQELLRAFADRV